MDNTPHHRCHVMEKFGDRSTSLCRVIINRQDITLPTGVKPANGIYGALELSVDNDCNIRCYFVLTGDDDDFKGPLFVLNDDFVRHIREEAQLKHPKTLVRKFDLDADIGKVFEFDNDEHEKLMRHLAAQWLSHYLAANFTFQVEIVLHGHSIDDGADAVVRMTRPWSGICEEFRAEFEPKAMYVGQNSKYGRRFFGKAA